MNDWTQQYNNQFFYSLVPYTPNLYWSFDYSSLAWLDLFSGLCSYEIWRSKNNTSYVYVGLTPIGATGYADINAPQNAILNYILKAVNQYGYQSPPSLPSINILSPLVFGTDQTILTPVIFASFNISAGGTCYINWGDTNIDTLAAGAHANVTHNYGVNGLYPIYIYGSLEHITSIEMSSQVLSYSTLLQWNLPFFTTACTFNFNSCAFTNLPQGDFRNVSIYNFAANSCNTIAVSNFLIYLSNFFTGNIVPLRSCTYTINGAGMGIVNALGLLAKADIQAKYIAAGFVATINNN